MLRSAWSLWVIVPLLLASWSDPSNAQEAPQTCYEWTGSTCSWEPNLQAMRVDFGAQNETFYAYVLPDVSTFYNKTAKSLAAVPVTGFTGMFGKFINMSPETIRVYWEGKEWSYITDIEPFGSSGTATYTGHKFVATPLRSTSTVLIRWTMESETSLYYYDPFQFDIQKAHKKLTADQFTYYRMQWRNKIFAEQYRAYTGRDWLALYQLKQPPRFHMWPADSLGQVHVVETKEIHFVEMPESDELDRGMSQYGPRPDERSRVRRHRHRDASLTLTLKVLSCAPRVFEIKNFLSDVEVEHILEIAGELEMKRSSTRASSNSETTKDDATRTSTNSWVARNTDIVTDAIYRRAADLLQMDEALLRWRRKTELPEFTESTISVSERLQLVHYGVGEQYTPHHDFTMPGLVHLQPARFATILLYLNDDMEGGETSFPRWLNADPSGQALKVRPEKGKAVLFYNVLPDGNFDERSQHAALPVIQGEKYLTNLWVWEPYLDHTSVNIA